MQSRYELLLSLTLLLLVVQCPRGHAAHLQRQHRGAFLMKGSAAASASPTYIEGTQVLRPEVGFDVVVDILDDPTGAGPTAHEAAKRLQLHMQNPGTRDEGMKGFLDQYGVPTDVEIPTMEAVTDGIRNAASGLAAAAGVEIPGLPPPPGEAPASPPAETGGGGDVVKPIPPVPAAGMMPHAPGPSPSFGPSPGPSPCFGMSPGPAPAPFPVPCPIAATMFSPSAAGPGGTDSTATDPLGMDPSGDPLAPPGMQPLLDVDKKPPLATPPPLMQAPLGAYGVTSKDADEAAATEPAWDPEAPEPVWFKIRRSSLVRKGVSCQSNHQELKPQPSWKKCAERAGAVDGRFFSYGTQVTFVGSQPFAKCNVDYAGDETCPEGFKWAPFDFYRVESFLIKAVPVRMSVSCVSMNSTLPHAHDSDECARRAAMEGGSYFSFGKGIVAGECYTRSPVEPGAAAHEGCATGFLTGTFDFYKIEEKVAPAVGPHQQDPFRLPPMPDTPVACLKDCA